MKPAEDKVFRKNAAVLRVSGGSKSAGVSWTNLGRAVPGLSVRPPLLGAASHHPEDLLFRELS